MEEERACAVIQGERGRQGEWKLPGDQIDESYHETVGESNRFKVTIAEKQFGFMPGRSTTDAIFCLWMLMEKWIEGQKAVHCVFCDLLQHMIEHLERKCGNACTDRHTLF